MANEPEQGKKKFINIGSIIEKLKGIPGVFKDFHPGKRISEEIKGFKVTEKTIRWGKIALLGGGTALLGIIFGLLYFLIINQFNAKEAGAVSQPKTLEVLPPGSNLSAPEKFNRLFYAFSPLAERVYLWNLDLEDLNNNGDIDMGEEEGYEEFNAKYGNADRGFWVNGITQGNADGKLEEPEIINHYYLAIRYRFPRETGLVEAALAQETLEGDIPLIWRDDRNGSVMEALQAVARQNRIPWPDKPADEAEAEALFKALLQGLRVRESSGNPELSGYRELPDFINLRAGYGGELARFAFWLFSEIGVNGIPVRTSLTPEFRQEVIKFVNSGKIIDYFGVSDAYNVEPGAWRIVNPLQSLGDYYYAQAEQRRNRRDVSALYEQALRYDKYRIDYAAALLEDKLNAAGADYQEIIAMGEFYIQKLDLRGILISQDPETEKVLTHLESILAILIQAYSIAGDGDNAERIEGILREYGSQQGRQEVEF